MGAAAPKFGLLVAHFFKSIAVPLIRRVLVAVAINAAAKHFLPKPPKTLLGRQGLDQEYEGTIEEKRIGLGKVKVSGLNYLPPYTSGFDSSCVDRVIEARRYPAADRAPIGPSHLQWGACIGDCLEPYLSRNEVCAADAGQPWQSGDLVLLVPGPSKTNRTPMIKQIERYADGWALCCNADYAIRVFDEEIFGPVVCSVRFPPSWVLTDQAAHEATVEAHRQFHEAAGALIATRCQL